MSVVVDAQIICQFYKESVLGLPNEHYTCEVLTVFDSISPVNRIFVDEGEHIYQEWKNLVNEEWLRVWYEKMIIDDKVVLIPVEVCQVLRQKLSQLGFPLKGGDFWYLRTAISMNRLGLNPIIITEDLDFYEPAKKKTAVQERKRILMGSSGLICRYLRKREGILILCVCNYLDHIAAQSE